MVKGEGEVLARLQVRRQVNGDDRWNKTFESSAGLRTETHRKCRGSRSVRKIRKPIRRIRILGMGRPEMDFWKLGVSWGNPVRCVRGRSFTLDVQHLQLSRELLSDR